MSTIFSLLFGAVLLVGLAFNYLGAIALYRFPDVFTRLHGTTKCTTFGTIFSCFSVMLWAVVRLLYTGETRYLVLIVHVAVALTVLLVTNATGAHAIARAAWRSGVRPHGAVVDRLAEDMAKEEAR